MAAAARPTSKVERRRRRVYMDRASGPAGMAQLLPRSSVHGRLSTLAASLTGRSVRRRQMSGTAAPRAGPVMPRSHRTNWTELT